MIYVEKFLVNIEYAKNYSKNTVISYQNDLEHFIKYLKNRDILSVGKGDIEKYLRSFNDKSEKTLARNISTLKMFFEFLVKENYISVSPMKDIPMPKIGVHLPDVLSIEEVEKLLDVRVGNEFDFRNKCILETLYSTGLRISELVNLKLENIFLDDNFIKVMGKGSKERIVFLNDTSTNLLKEYILNIRPKMIKKTVTDYLFLNNHGKCISRQAIFKMIKSRGEECKISKNIGPHTLRHSFASHLLQNGANIKYIQELLGHSDLSTTEIYTHIINEHLKNDYMNLIPRDN